MGDGKRGVALVFAGGDPPVPAELDGLPDADLVIAADSGLHHASALGRRVDVVVGDLDSADPALVERLEAAGTRIDRHPVDKEASDTELAVHAALAGGADRVDLLGATGGDRLDHELANLLLLADPALSGVELRAVVAGTTIRAARGGDVLTLRGDPGDLVTLLPISGDAGGVTTAGLRWALDGSTLPMGGSRGLSNVVVESGASVRLTEGVLLVIETASTGEQA